MRNVPCSVTRHLRVLEKRDEIAGEKAHLRAVSLADRANLLSEAAAIVQASTLKAKLLQNRGFISRNRNCPSEPLLKSNIAIPCHFRAESMR